MTFEFGPSWPVPIDDEVLAWTPGSQEAEQEADADLAHGRFRDYKESEALLADFQDVIEKGSARREP